MADERGIDRAKRELAESKASGKHGDFAKHATMILDTAMKLKKLMVDRGLTAAKAKCPKCLKENLHGRLIVGKAAGRHRNSGGAFRMWCDTCEDVRMLQ